MMGTVCFCSKVRRSSRRLMRLYDEALAPSELTVMQYAALRTAERLEGPSLSRLAEVTGHDRTAMWRLLQPLARKGLVAVGGTPRKGTAVTLTERGRNLIAEALPCWEAAQARVEAALGGRAQELFAALDEVEALAL